MKALGITLKDAGYLPTKDELPKGTSTVGSEKDEKRYATVYATDRELPGLEGLTFGETYLMVAAVHVKQKTTSESNDKKPETRGTLEIHQVAFKPYNRGKAADLSDEELAEAIGTGTYEEEE